MTYIRSKRIPIAPALAALVGLAGCSGSGPESANSTLTVSGDVAIAYAKRNGIAYRVYEPQERVVHPKSYAENFIRRV